MTTNFDLNVCICSEDFSTEELERIIASATKEAEQIKKDRERKIREAVVEEFNQRLRSLILEAREQKIHFSDGVPRGQYVSAHYYGKPHFWG